MKINKFLIISLAVLSLAGCAKKDNLTTPGASSAPSASETIPYLKGVGKSLLNQTVTSPQGDTISLIPTEKQHITVVSLWCPTWFNGSHTQLQELIKLQQAYGDKGVRIVVVAYDTASKDISEAIKNMNITFEMGTGNAALYEALEVSSIPTTWYLDSAGAVVKVVNGFEGLEEMSADIEELRTSLQSLGDDGSTGNDQANATNAGTDSTTSSITRDDDHTDGNSGNSVASSASDASVSSEFGITATPASSTSSYSGSDATSTAELSKSAKADSVSTSSSPEEASSASPATAVNSVTTSTASDTASSTATDGNVKNSTPEPLSASKDIVSNAVSSKTSEDKPPTPNTVKLEGRATAPSQSRSGSTAIKTKPADPTSLIKEADSAYPPPPAGTPQQR